MTRKLRVEPRVTRLVNYLEEIKKGELVVPEFQRDFIWNKKQRLELFESMEKEYPIGALLFWKPDDQYKIKKEIGTFKSPESIDNPFYILDGFQRMTTLFGCLMNPTTSDLKVVKNRLKDFSIYYDLFNQEFTYLRMLPPESHFLPVNILINTHDFLNFCEKLRASQIENPNTLIDRAKILVSTLLDFQLPTVQIFGGQIEDAVEIFTKVNTKGSTVSTDWMVSALTYNEKDDFRLASKIDQLLVDLEKYNFEYIKRELIFQCIRSSFGKYYADQKIKDLIKKQDFQEVAAKSLSAIEKAIKFLFKHLLVVDSKLLPYSPQLIFLSQFFIKIKEPTPRQIEALKEWFWTTTYANYFTIYTISKTRKAFAQFLKFIEGKTDNLIYNENPNKPFEVAPFPDKIYLGSVRAKALALYMLNYANNFQTVKVKTTKGFSILYLTKNKTLKNSGAAVLYLEKTNEKVIKEIKNNSDFYSKEYFADNFKTLYNGKAYKTIFKTRQDLIRKSEAAFISKNGNLTNI